MKHNEIEQLMDDIDDITPKLTKVLIRLNGMARKPPLMTDKHLISARNSVYGAFTMVNGARHYLDNKNKEIL